MWASQDHAWWGMGRQWTSRWDTWSPSGSFGWGGLGTPVLVETAKAWLLQSPTPCSQKPLQHTAALRHTAFPQLKTSRVFTWLLTCCWESSYPQRLQSVPGTQKHVFFLAVVHQGWHIICFTCSCLCCSLSWLGYVQLLRAPTRNVKWQRFLLDHCRGTGNRFCFVKLKRRLRASWAASVTESCLPSTECLRRLCWAQCWCCCPRHHHL